MASYMKVYTELEQFLHFHFRAHHLLLCTQLSLDDISFLVHQPNLVILESE